MINFKYRYRGILISLRVSLKIFPGCKEVNVMCQGGFHGRRLFPLRRRLKGTSIKTLLSMVWSWQGISFMFIFLFSIRTIDSLLGGNFLIFYLFWKDIKLTNNWCIFNSHKVAKFVFLLRITLNSTIHSQKHQW